MVRIDAKAVIGKETTPLEDGAKLGRHVFGLGSPLGDLEIDVSEVAPEDLVSTFVNAFLHELEAQGSSVRDADEIVWLTKYPSENERLRLFVTYYVQDAIASEKP